MASRSRRVYPRSMFDPVAPQGDDANDSPLEDRTVRVAQNLTQPEFHQHSDMHTTNKTYQETIGVPRGRRGHRRLSFRMFWSPSVKACTIK
ncbi:hypothetical protein DPMN_132703 [Dreissena polymorpha]|uniref:Uncharacterized protein n=1 Tax=Dreissena polymorpha TaxID=45954 RepID=A0A9D4FWG5_DREPO|nr:hypothetical protein DPMN_132703 [Dreissena polymorpha]